MSFFDRGKRRVPPNATFKITQEGEEKLGEFNGDPKSQVLMALQVGGTANIDEICNSPSVSLNRGQVERLIPVLAQGGYIQYIGGQSE